MADPRNTGSRTTLRSALHLAACVMLVLAGAAIAWPIASAFALSTSWVSKAGAPVVLEISVLVFREGLECMLVLAAIVTGMTGGRHFYRGSVAWGAALGAVATLCTWCVAVHVVDDLSQSISALAMQAATGLLAVLVLLLVMNWFFHKVYWTGWISLHNRRKWKLLGDANGRQSSRVGLVWGLGLLGFTSLYREGFEVVLFLQSYRLRWGSGPVFIGACGGLLLTGVVVALTIVAHRRLPYRKMLVVTGALLGLVLLVMVGEQAQEMQLAHWIPTTNLPFLAGIIPAWMGLWLSIFPTVETLLAQGVAAVLVLGSYVLAGRKSTLANHRRKLSASVAPPQGLEAEELESDEALVG